MQLKATEEIKVREQHDSFCILTVLARVWKMKWRKGKELGSYCRSPDERWLWLELEWWSRKWREVTTFEICFRGWRVRSWKWIKIEMKWNGRRGTGLDITWRVLEKLRCQQGHAPSRGSRGESILCLFQLPVSFWHPLTCGQLLPSPPLCSMPAFPWAFSSVLNLSLLSSHKDTWH